MGLRGERLFTWSRDEGVGGNALDAEFFVGDFGDAPLLVLAAVAFAV